MTDAERKASHKRPEFLAPAGKGRYQVKGTELLIVQADGKWRIEGHRGDLGAFAKRQDAAGKLQELGLVPEVPAEKPVQPERPEAEKSEAQPEARPTGRKPRKPAKEAVKASA